MMTPITDLLSALGHATASTVWIPVLVWTLLAAPVAWAVWGWTEGAALLRYRLLQCTLFALPAGVAVSALETAALLRPIFSAPPSPSPAPSAPSTDVLFSVGVMRAPEPVVPEAVYVATGVLTVAAAGAAVVGTVRFAREVWGSLRLRDALTLRRAPDLQREAEDLARRFGVRRPVAVRWTEDDVVPMTMGSLSPVIALPTSLADAPRRRTWALMHELVHVRRYDDVSAAAERLLDGLAGLHPLVRVLTSRLAALREQACDAAVLSHTGGERAAYAELLFSFADRPVPATGSLLLAESPSSLETRLQAMNSTAPSPSRTALWLLTGALSLLLIAGITACSDSVSPSSDSGASATSTEAATRAPVSASNVDAAPQPEGGMRAVHEAIEYPELVAKAGIEGRVFVEFVVDPSGAVKDARAVNPSGADAVTHEALQRAAVDAVKSVTWTPGSKDDTPVPVEMTLPVTFRLDDPYDDTGDASRNATGDASSPSASPKLTSGGSIFEKAGIQVVRVRMSQNGDLHVGDEPVEISRLSDAVRQRITRDAARAALLYADGAPSDRLDAAKARLQSLNLQKVYVQKVE
jgi:TonB family protein